MSELAMTFAALSSLSTEFFRFLDLPGEVRDDIYRKYFGFWDACVEYDRMSALFKIGGIPLFNFMLANHTTHAESNYLISESFSGRLTMRDTKVRRERGFGFRSSLDIIASLCPRWLLDRTEILVIEQGTPSMLSTVPWSKLPNLREVHLAGSSWPASPCYPCGLSERAKSTQEDHVLAGVYDTWRVDCYQSWSQVPKQVANGHVQVITIKEGFVKGTPLKVRIVHRRDSVEVLDRSINSVVQTKSLEDIPQTTNEVPAGSCQLM